MKLADSVMRRRVKAPCGSDLPIAIVGVIEDRDQEIAPTTFPDREISQIAIKRSHNVMEPTARDREITEATRTLPV